jgi:energy-coupling factor transporter ATP-binding protein EcfA2
MATRLRRLKIEHFRDVRPGTELRFGDGWNVLVGRNGSGKTTLLNLISMVLRDDLTALQGEVFAIEYEMEVDAGEAYVVRASNSHAARSGMGVGNEFSVSVRVTKIGPNRAIRWVKTLVADSLLKAIAKTGSEPFVTPNPLASSRVLAFVTGPEGESIQGVPSLKGAIGLLGDAFRVDEGVAMFDVLTGTAGHARSGLPLRSAIRNFDLSANGIAHRYLDLSFVPSALRELLEKLSAEARASIEFDLGGDETLDRCVRLLGRGRVVVVATSTTMDEGPSSGLSFGNFRFFSQHGLSPLVPHEHWSFGQKRLLTFFWYLACNPDVLVADELVNGLHWDWIDACVDSIGTRQVFVSAQNPLLLDHLGFDSEDSVAHGFVLCRSAPVGEGRSETVWTHPDAAQSAEFFRSYQNGVMQVHDILRTQGLW